MNRRLATAIVLAVFGSCGIGRGPLQRKIAREIEACTPTDGPCVIRLADLTWFTWDTMYVFGEGATPEDIQKVTGASFPDYTETSTHLVFLMNGAAVFHEQYQMGIEQPRSGEIFFELPTGQAYQKYSPESAVFIGRKLSTKGVVSYDLSAAR